MYVFELSAEHTLRDAGNVTLKSDINGVACTRRDGVTLVAFSHADSVSLQRLTSLPLRLVPLATVSLPALPNLLLFREDLLLVVYYRDIETHAIVSFRTSDNALTERRVLLDFQAGEYVSDWTLAGDRLVLCNNLISEELRVYAFT